MSDPPILVRSAGPPLRSVRAPAPPSEPPVPARAPDRLAEGGPGDDASLTIRLDTRAAWPTPTAETTVQLLPAWLEVLDGLDGCQEYRFTRSPGDAAPRFTLGRAREPAFRHICIPQATVSRMHASVQYRDRVWSIRNLSHTNPLRVNDHELLSSEESHVLTDGDTLQLGGVLLCFREGRPRA